MSSIKIEPSGTTFISAAYPDANASYYSVLYAGTSKNTHDYQTLIFFHIPDSLKQNDISVSKVTLNLKKKNAYHAGNAENGFHASYYIYSAVNDNSGTITYNTNVYKDYLYFGKYIINTAYDGLMMSQDIDVGIFNWASNYLVVKITGHGEAGTDGLYYTEFYSDSISLDVSYTSKRPIVNITSHPEKQNSAESTNIQWSYSSGMDYPQKSIEFQYSANNGVSWVSLTIIETGYTNYKISEDTFPAGRLLFRMRATDSEGNVSDWIEPVEFIVYDPLPVIALEDWDVTNFNNAAALTLTWTFSSENNFTQTKYVIEWKEQKNGTWNTVEKFTSEQSYTFPSKSFPVGTITLRLKVVDSHGFESEWCDVSFDTYNQRPIVTIGYPNNVNVNNQNKTVFAWLLSEEVKRGQKSYELQWMKENEESWTTIHGISSNQYHEFVAETFPTGNIVWRIRATDIDGNTSEWASASFVSIGITEAPQIIEVSNDAIPTITWNADLQDCFEVRIRKDSKIIYTSGLMPGADIRSFRCNTMLADGVYSVEMRMVNTYGYYTEWNTYSFVLETAKPQAAQISEISIQKDFSVEISGVIPTGLKAYVVRKNARTNETVIIGVYESEFYDYTVPLNQEHFYTIRTYNAAAPSGYTDGAWKRIFIETDGMVLHDVADMKNFIHAHFGEDTLFQIGRTDTCTKTFHNVIGRKYPVKERMDWMTSQREAAVWLSDEEYERIQDISTSSGNVYYRAEKEAFLCDMEIQLTGRYVGGGKLVKISLNRLDEDAEENLL